MKRASIMWSAALIGGCSSPSLTGVPAIAERSPETCTVDPLGKLIDEPASAILAANALLLSGARSIRWVPKNGAVTMDFRPDRLNVALDRRNRIEKFTCG